MSTYAENVAMLHLLNQDTKELSLDELYYLYRKTLDAVKECEKHYCDAHKGNAFSFN